MADLVHNIAKGRGVQFGINVDTNTPTDSAIILSVWFNDGSSTDDNVRDADTVAAIEALTGVTERTTSGWSRTTYVDTDVTVTLDDTNNNHRVDVPDKTWTAVTAGASSDLGYSYDSDTAAGTDSNIIPVTWHDFAITPDGSDVTAQVHADGILSAG
jgi:hypothetical protein